MNLQALMPWCLGMIMFTMGLGLRLDDFSKLFSAPAVVIAGLLGQLALLPLLAVCIALLMDLSAPLAIGLVLIALCPGGITSNLFARLAQADTALSVTLTAISSLLTVITVPFIFNLASEFFAGDQASVTLPFLKTVQQIAILTLLPVALGMVTRKLAEKHIEWIEKAFSTFSTLFFIAVIISLWQAQWDSITHAASQVGPAVISLNLVALTSGFVLGLLTTNQVPRQITLCLEVGVQNSALAFFIAVNLLQQMEYSLAAACYSVVMVITALITIPIGRALSARYSVGKLSPTPSD